MHIVTALSLLAAASSATPTPRCELRRESVTVMLGDFPSHGEIVRPPLALPSRGLAILFGGSDVADLDSAIVEPDGRIVARPLAQVADALACAGIASLRYNKRFVTGPTSVDRARFDRLNGPDLAADGISALDRARVATDLARLPVALVGWSEGSTVAMAVAARRLETAAVVLLAPVVSSPAATAQAQYARIGKPYLSSFATGGALDASAIARAKAGPGGVLAQIFVRMFQGFRPGERTNPLLDTNRDGRISFSEADPVIASWYSDTPGGGLGIAATGRALPGLAESWRPASPPLLILQGANDAMIDPAAAQSFATKHANERVSFRLYPKLGHGLGPARSPIEDALRPIGSRPLQDMTMWLRNKLRTTAP